MIVKKRQIRNFLLLVHRYKSNRNEGLWVATPKKKLFLYFSLCMCYSTFSLQAKNSSSSASIASSPTVVSEGRTLWRLYVAESIRFLCFSPLYARYFSRNSTKVISSTYFCMNFFFRANFLRKNRLLVKGRNREDSLFLAYKREDVHVKKPCIWFFINACSVDVRLWRWSYILVTFLLPWLI